MSLENKAEEYFSSLNSIANRMYEDMRETKSTYENLWETIPEKEQKQILSESIITPEVAIKYKEEENEDVKDYAVKFIMDDHCTYRDEHSGPFSFKTRSQMDFTLLTDEDRVPVPPKKLKPKVTKKVNPVFLENIAITQSNNDEHSPEINSVPKTGLDFLDNW